MSSSLDRRNFLRHLSSAGMTSAFAPLAFAADNHGATAPLEQTAAVPSPDPVVPKTPVRFSVCGMSHDHIYGMVGAMQRGGATLVAFFGEEPDKVAAFHTRFPEAQQAASEEAILGDPGTQLVLSSTVASRRAPLGVRVMHHGKDFLSDKPGITTLEQLAEVRRAIAETGRTYAIMYSERLEVRAAVKAGDLVQSGAIGKVIQTINIAPHQIEQPVHLAPGAHPDPHAGPASRRPDWFWDPELYGGILTDIGSHQVDQFLFYTGSTSADVVESQVANVHHPQHPRFQDFGDMVLRGNRGLGYVRLDWFTPDGLGTWGDGRLFILGTEGYIEVRKYTNVAVNSRGNNLFLVDRTSARYLDCNNVPLPFGPQFVQDVLHRTHVAQDQTQCLLAAELVLKAQRDARKVTLEA